MNVLPPIPAGTTCFTNTLVGASLDELLEHAERNWWPEQGLVPEWDLLRNWAMQTESLQVDEAENFAWEEQMRELMQRELPYKQWIVERGKALKARLRARKLAQTNLRHKYGFKSERRWGLVITDVRRFYDTWSSA